MLNDTFSELFICAYLFSKLFKQFKHYQSDGGQSQAADQLSLAVLGAEFQIEIVAGSGVTRVLGQAEGTLLILQAGLLLLDRQGTAALQSFAHDLDIAVGVGRGGKSTLGGG